MFRRGILVAAALAVCSPAAAATVTLTFDPGTYTLLDDSGGIRTYAIAGGFQLSMVGTIEDGVIRTAAGPNGPGGFSFYSPKLPSGRAVSFDIRGTGMVHYVVYGSTGDISLTPDFVTYGAFSGSPQFTVSTATDIAEVDNVVFDNGVPEPATWAMMVAGFGLLGFAARRKVNQYAVA
jgi:hypothetical protein